MQNLDCNCYRGQYHFTPKERFLGKEMAFQSAPVICIGVSEEGESLLSFSTLTFVEVLPSLL